MVNRPDGNISEQASNLLGQKKPVAKLRLHEPAIPLAELMRKYKPEYRGVEISFELRDAIVAMLGSKPDEHLEFVTRYLNSCIDAYLLDERNRQANELREMYWPTKPKPSRGEEA